MVNFAHKLKSDQISKWSAHYLDYSGLQDTLKSKVYAECRSEDVSTFFSLSSPKEQKDAESSSSPLLEVTDVSEIAIASTPPDAFQRHLIDEIARVNRFYLKKLNEYEERLETCHEQLSHERNDVSPEAEEGMIQDWASRADQTKTHASVSIRKSFIDIYRQILYLQSYAIVNYTGFVKIIKKYEKNYDNVSGIKEKYLSSGCKDMNFKKHERLDEMVREIEVTVSEAFFEGDMGVARAMLLAEVKHGDADWTFFSTGLRLGVCIMLLMWVLWDCFVDAKLREQEEDGWVEEVMPIYRGLGCLLLAGWLWGVNLYVWTRFRINYLYIFELDEEHTLTYEQVFSRVTLWTIWFCVNFLLYFKTCRGEMPRSSSGGNAIPAGVFPISLSITFLINLFYMWGSNKLFWGKLILQTLISPFSTVTFTHAYIGDVMTSLVKVFVDLAYISCWFYQGLYLRPESWTPSHPVWEDRSGQCLDSEWLHKYVAAVLSSLPLWIRFQQNLRRYYDTHNRFPSLANAGKYACAFIVFLLGVFQNHFDSYHTVYHVMWYLAYAVATLYAFIWDITQDWGLMHRKHGFLRQRLMLYYGRRYWAAICVDLVLRFGWTLTFLSSGLAIFTGAKVMLYLTPTLASAELCRRSMWSWFRLENEHLTNTEGYRRVKFIPLHFAKPKKKIKPKTATGIFVEIIVLFVLLAGIAVTVVITRT